MLTRTRQTRTRTNNTGIITQNLNFLWLSMSYSQSSSYRLTTLCWPCVLDLWPFTCKICYTYHQVSLVMCYYWQLALQSAAVNLKIGSNYLSNLQMLTHTITVVITTATLQHLCTSIYTVSQKNETLYSCPQFRQILTDFQNSFTIRLSKKFTIKKSLKIPSHLKCVATLPCEIWMSITINNLKQCNWLTINFNKINQTSKKIYCFMNYSKYSKCPPVIWLQAWRRLCVVHAYCK